MSGLGWPQGVQGEREELSVPLLDQESGEIHAAATEASSTSREGPGAQQQAPSAAASGAEGDLEQGLLPGSDAGEGGSKAEEAEEAAIEAAARASCQSGALVYAGDLLRLVVFYWAIVADALLMKELWDRQHVLFAGLSTGFTVGPHVLMSLLLIIRQGWLQAASQACGFILTLNPFDSLSPIPQGVLGVFVVAVGFIAYVLIAASGLIFVAYCVVCYLVTALLFSLLILDLAALVITVAPSKAIFKYTDLVYTENFKFSRLVLQAWLQSAPELCVIAAILWRNLGRAGPAVEVAGPVLLQALAAHAVNLLDKTLLFRSAARFSGAGCARHLLSLLRIKGSCRLSLPALKDNLDRVLRGAGGGEAGAALGSVVHISCAEEAPDTDSEAAASMVPEYLTPTNGGLLSPGQLAALARAVFGRYGGPGVAELVLDVTPDVVVGKLLGEVLPAAPNTTTIRLVNASLRGADASALASALLQCSCLRTLQLHSAVVDERGALALAQLLQHTPTLQQLDLCRCRLRRRAPRALAQGLRGNRTLRQLNLAGSLGLDEAGASALAAAVASSKVLCALNLAFVPLGMGAVESLEKAIASSSSLRVLAVSQSELPQEGAAKLLAAVAALRRPKAPPSLSCNLPLGTFPVHGLDKVQWLLVQDQDALMLDPWQGMEGVAGAGGGEADEEAGMAGPPGGGGGGGGTAAAAAGWAAAAGGTGAGSRHDGDGSGDGDAGGSGGVDGERVPLLGPAAGRPAARWPPPPVAPPPSPPPSAFGVDSPAPANGGGSSSSAGGAAAATAATAAWFSGPPELPLPSPSGPTAAPPQQAAPPPPPHARRPSSAPAAAAAAAGTGPCPSLVFVVTQEEAVDCMVKAPLLFAELDSLDLTGLGVGDEGAAAMACVLEQGPNLRRLVLSDNKVGEEGGAALAAAVTLNSTLQVLDLSSNELSEVCIGVLAQAVRSAQGLRQLRLLGNKIPFGLTTLRQLVEAEAASPHCHIVLVEDPAEVLEALEAAGDAQRAARAADFYRRQEQFRRQRRQRAAARQQRLQEQAAAGAAPPAPAAAPDGGAGSSGGAAAGAAGGAASPEPPPAASDAAGSASSAAAEAPAAAAVSPSLSPLGSAGASGSLSSLAADEDTCGVCFDSNNHVAIKFCGHRLCVDCYRKVWELSGSGSTCPFCRARLEGYMYLDWPLEA